MVACYSMRHILGMNNQANVHNVLIAADSTHVVYSKQFIISNVFSIIHVDHTDLLKSVEQLLGHYTYLHAYRQVTTLEAMYIVEHIMRLISGRLY